MDLDHWRLLVMLSELGSLSKAAIVLDRPHSVISRKLSALERECGGPLFYRTGRGVVLSELGARILPRVRALTEEADKLARAVRSEAGEVTGRVKIGMVPAVSRVMINPLVAAMNARLPHVTLSLSEGNNVQLGESVRSGDVDLALLFRDRRNLASTEEALLIAPAYLVGPPGDKLTSRPEAPFRDLAGIPLIVSSERGLFRQRVEHWAERLGVPLNPVVEADSLGIQESLVLAGSGYCILTSLAAAPGVQSGRLSAARIVDPDLEFVLALCRTMQRPLSAPARECIRIIKEVAGPLFMPTVRTPPKLATAA